MTGVERKDRTREIFPTWLFWATPLAIKILFIVIHPGEVNHDCALLLHGAQLLLEGQLPYIGFVELNPPLITYLNVVPVAIAKILNTHPIPIFNLLVVACVAASIASTRSLLKRLPRIETVEIDLFLGAWATYSLALLGLPGMPFGQRDHLILLAMLPLWVLRWLRSAEKQVPTSLAVVIGLGAGLGLALKPFYIVLWLAPEIVWQRRRLAPRSLFRPEILTMASVAFAYLAHFLLLPAMVLTEYFDRWLPMVVSGYSVFDAPMRDLLRDPRLIRVLVVAIVAIAMGARKPGLGELLTPLGVAAGAALACYLWQQKGWDYQLVPATGCAVLALTLLLFQIRSYWPSKRSPGLLERLPAWTVGLAILAVTANVFQAAGPPAERVRGVWVRDDLAKWLAETTESDEPIMILSSNVRASYPMMMQLGRRPGSRFLCQFQIPFFYADLSAEAGDSFPYRSLAEAAPEERRFLEELESDIRASKPAVILVELGSCAGCPAGFSLSEYLEHNGFMDRILEGYVPGPVQDRFDSYVREGSQR